MYRWIVRRSGVFLIEQARWVDRVGQEDLSHHVYGPQGVVVVIWQKCPLPSARGRREWCFEDGIREKRVMVEYDMKVAN
jgi:hypothetical protein